MRLARLALAVLAAALVLATPARAADMSPNVEQVASIPEVATAIAVNFIGDTMFVSTVTGVYSYDVTDPAKPVRLGALPMYIWENEDMDVDVKRKRLFISRDPRGFTSPATPGAAFPVGAVHIIDVANPRAMVQVGFFTLPAGHTSTCVNDCDFLWTGGPYKNAETQPAEWVGRPIYATDVRDPLSPKPCPEPIDTARNDGVTDYVHDVQVDSRGVAWVSGGGGVRGYWTRGEHFNPVTGKTETATACKPVPYAGSGTPNEATPSRFMHNAFRDPEGPGVPGTPVKVSKGGQAGTTVSGPASSSAPPAAGAPAPAAQPRAAAKRCTTKSKSKPKAKPKKKAKSKAKRRGAKARTAAKRKPPRKRSAARRGTCSPPKSRPRTVRKVKARAAAAAATATTGGIPAERILYGTEENLGSDCKTSGRFVTYDLQGTFAGEGFKDIAKTKHRMKVLDTWTPEKQEGATGCASAHYFASRGDGIFANSFYEQGVRFLDVSDPRDIKQVGWWRPASGADTFATYWYKGYVVVADFSGGVQILKFNGSAGRGKAVAAPPLGTSVAKRAMDPELGFLCPLPNPV